MLSFKQLMKKVSVLIPSVLVLAAMIFTGCAPSSAPDAVPQAGELSGTINEAGSTSVQPLAELLATAFTAKYPKVTVNISGGGSSAGVKAIAAGTVDLGAASRDIKISEPDVIPVCIARDGVAIVVHESNPLTGLTIEQVAKIYAGEITNWRDVGGTDALITVVSREEGSGTREVFEEYVTGAFKKKIKTGALFFDSNGAIRSKVASDKNAVGYISFGYIAGLKALKVNNIDATVDNAQNGKYPIVRRLYLLTKSMPSGIVKEFIDFCRGPEGQKIALDEGYIPIVLK